MNKEEFLQNLIDNAPTDTDEADKFYQALDNAAKKIPQCNKCAAVLSICNGKPTYRNVEVSVHWGYNSTGKDTDHDKWWLCESCKDEFDKRYDPICSICQRTITDVMAELDARNPNCTFFGDKAAAVEHIKGNNHCGLEYATISGRTVCEICYEDFINDFAVPIQAASYHCFTGERKEREGFQRKDRIQEALNYVLTESYHSYYFRDKLSYEEVVEIRSMSDKNSRCISLRFEQDKPEMAAKLDAMTRARGKTPEPELETVTAQMGNNSYIGIPASWLRQQSEKQNAKLDLTQLKISNLGSILSFGELAVAATEILQFKEDSQ